MDVGFTREVGQNSAIYWKKDELAHVIEKAEELSPEAIAELDRKSNQRIANAFTWNKIVADYESLFEG